MEENITNLPWRKMQLRVAILAKRMVCVPLYCLILFDVINNYVP